MRGTHVLWLIIMWNVPGTEAAWLWGKSLPKESIIEMNGIVASCSDKIVEHIVKSVSEEAKFEAQDLEHDVDCLKDLKEKTKLRTMSPTNAKKLVRVVLDVKDRSKRSNIAAGVKQYIISLVGGEYITDILMAAEPKTKLENGKEVSSLKKAATDSMPCGEDPKTEHSFESDYSASILSLIYWLEQLQTCPAAPSASDQSADSQSVIHNQAKAIDAMVKAAHEMARMSHESLQGAALTAVLNSYIDLTQRGLLQLATLNEESEKIDSAERQLLAAMKTYYIDIKN